MPDNIFPELNEFFRNLTFSPPSSLSVLAAVSGGADSVALVHLLLEYRQKLGIGRLAVAHVNHGLRGEESDGDEAFVAETAERLRLEFFRARLTGFSIDDAGIEDSARRNRYAFFTETMKKHGFTHTATAHTANDQAETALMRLIRGTGVRGLRGIHPVRADGVIRPLLNVERRRLESWLLAKGLSYRTDTSNADEKFLRNYIRHRVVPLLLEVNPAAVRNIAACAASAARVWDVVAGRVGEWTKRYVLRINEDAFHVEKNGLLNNETVASEAMVALFEEYGISASKLHITRVFDAAGLSSGEHLLPDGWKMYPREDRVCFVRKC